MYFKCKIVYLQSQVLSYHAGPHHGPDGFRSVPGDTVVLWLVLSLDYTAQAGTSLHLVMGLHDLRPCLTFHTMPG